MATEDSADPQAGDSIIIRRPLLWFKAVEGEDIV